MPDLIKIYNTYIQQRATVWLPFVYYLIRISHGTNCSRRMTISNTQLLRKSLQDLRLRGVRFHKMMNSTIRRGFQTLRFQAKYNFQMQFDQLLKYYFQFQQTLMQND